LFNKYTLISNSIDFLNKKGPYLRTKDNQYMTNMYVLIPVFYKMSNI